MPENDPDEVSAEAAQPGRWNTVTTDDIVATLHEMREERMRQLEEALGWGEEREGQNIDHS